MREIEHVCEQAEHLQVILRAAGDRFYGKWSAEGKEIFLLVPYSLGDNARKQVVLRPATALRCGQNGLLKEKRIRRVLQHGVDYCSVDTFLFFELTYFFCQSVQKITRICGRAFGDLGLVTGEILAQPELPAFNAFL